jgi:hypothetical protein
MEQHRLTQEAVFGAVARLGQDEKRAHIPVFTAEVHANLSREYRDDSFRTPTREAVYLQLHRLKKKRLLLSKRQGKEVSWELAARGRRLLEQKTQGKQKEAEMLMHPLSGGEGFDPEHSEASLEELGALTPEEAESCAAWLNAEQAERGPEGVGVEREHVTDGRECWCGPVTEKVVDLEETVELPVPGTFVDPDETEDPEADADGCTRGRGLEGSDLIEPNSDEEDDGA